VVWWFFLRAVIDRRSEKAVYLGLSVTLQAVPGGPAVIGRHSCLRSRLRRRDVWKPPHDNSVRPCVDVVESCHRSVQHGRDEVWLTVRGREHDALAFWTDGVPGM